MSSPSVINAAGRFQPPPQKSQQELYPLPFFNAATSCTWDVYPTGSYSDDCQTGRRAFAIELTVIRG
jgi:hypothetical protein